MSASKNPFLSLVRAFPLMRPVTRARSRGQRRKLFAIILLTFLIWILVDPTFYFRVITVFDYPFHYKEYREFGIRIPGNYKMHGIDVSRYQSRIDWKRVKKMKVGDVKIDFAFIKATEGSWIVDRYFGQNWTNARSAGIIRGAYHFFRPNVSPKAQAFNFMKTVSLRSGDLAPVVDIEEEDGMTRQQIRQNTKIFLDLLEKKYGVKPILYTNRDFYKNHFADLPEFDGYRFWIAHYHVAKINLPDDRDWHFWQHSDRGNVSGINEKVDFNVFNGDSADLKKLCLP